METERFERLVAVMAAMAAGDKAAVFSLYSKFWGQLATTIRKELRRLGVEHPGPEELDGMVIDACLVLFDCGGAWKPEGGALSWTWAERRLAGVVSDWIGQYADELDAERVGEEGDNGQAPAAGDDDEAELDVLLRMASRHAGCALVLEALERVASRRDQAIVLELRCQIAAGRPFAGADCGRPPQRLRRGGARGRLSGQGTPQPPCRRRGALRRAGPGRMMASRTEPRDAAGEEAALARHPTRARRPDLAPMMDRFADRLASEGHPWPDLSAAVLAERGRAGLDRKGFARTLGVTEEMLAGVEDGTRGGSPEPDVPD